ncbi:MAG: 4-phosphoerythronate dehydrogenase [Candidatus Brocadiia bacterium]
MKILVDENIPLARELFGTLGDVTLVKGRDVDADYPGLEEYAVLAIRSVTDITPELVDRARNCRVIGTATIGTDHIDDAYIRKVNPEREVPITVFSAPGSNADSVADYVWFCFCRVADLHDLDLSGCSLGIVGYGNCGSRVARRAAGFGMDVLRNDPPLAEREPAFSSDTLEDTLRADFVTMHVPLTHEGESAHPTHHMMGKEEFARMRSDAFFINSSRGAAVDSAALIATLEAGDIAGAVLDVFEGEPEPPEALISLPDIATPHIAGYAVEAKRRGAVVIYEKTCETLGVEPTDTAALLSGDFDPPAGLVVPFDDGGPTEQAADRAVRRLLQAIYDVTETSRELKETLGSRERGKLFDAMRKNYRRDYNRHELAMYRVGLAPELPELLREAIERRLRGFGVTVAAEQAHYVLEAGQP